MGIIIKINTAKIKKWREIRNKHKKYVEDYILKQINKNDKDILYILTGCEAYDEVRLKNNIEKLSIQQRENWKEIINRYEDKIKIDNVEMNILNIFYEDRSNVEKIVKNIKEKLNKEEGDKFEEIKLSTNITKFIMDKDIKSRKLTKVEKLEIINNSGYENYTKKLKLFEELKKIFNYNEFRNNEKEWNRHELITKLGIEVCPYCNRQYITSYKEEGKEKTTADLDHYYPQSKYPFLALSLYNFISSCQICNSRFKGCKTEETMYPYEESFDDEDVQYKFETSIKGDIRYLIGEDKDFTLSINKGKRGKNKDKLDRADNSNKIFKLDKVYQSHKGYVKELYEKAYKYNEVWRGDINEIFNNEDSLSIDKKELVEFAFGKNLIPEEYNKRPLAKLTRDILDEIGIEVE